VLDSIEDLSQEVRNAAAVSFQDRRRAQRARKQHVGSGQSVFAIAPRNFFHDDGVAAAAIDASHGIQQKDEEAP